MLLQTQRGRTCPADWNCRTIQKSRAELNMFLYCVRGLMCSLDASSRHSQLSEDTAGSALIIQHIHTSFLWNILYHCVQYSLCRIGPILLYLFVCVACDLSPLRCEVFVSPWTASPHDGPFRCKAVFWPFTSFASNNASHFLLSRQSCTVSTDIYATKETYKLSTLTQILYLSVYIFKRQRLHFLLNLTNSLSD